MKKLFLLLCAVILSGGLFAQDSLRVSSRQPRLEDVLQVLEMNDVFIHRFDLRSLLKAHYDVFFYVDEYRHAEKQGRVRRFMFGPNIESVESYPEEDREAVRKMFNLAPDEDEFEVIKDVTLTFRVVDDSLAYVSASSSGLGMMAGEVRLYPVVPDQGDAFYMYSTRPFRLDAVADADAVEIPLVFYGSAWYDKQAHITRFCGEDEIDPQLQAQIVKDVPHFYVVGMGLEKLPEEEQ